MAALEGLSENESEVLAFEAKLEADGKASLGEGEEGFEITKGMCSWKKGSKKISEIKFTPSVIEPSFGKRVGEWGGCMECRRGWPTRAGGLGRGLLFALCSLLFALALQALGNDEKGIRCGQDDT